tara:strand:+ start:281 stop:640 length:360 start_codon:yes stop_codon:yes gene_type:complete
MIYFHENVSIKIFDNNNCKIINKQIKDYDGPDVLSKLFCQLLIYTNNGLINNYNSLYEKYDKSILKYSNKFIIDNINNILFDFKFLKKEKYTFYNNYELINNSKTIKRLNKLKKLIINI